MRLENRTDHELDVYTLEIIRQVEDEGLLPAPKHMKQEILQRSRRADVQLAVHTREISKKMQFLLYSMKVGAAVAMALLMLFTVPREITRTELMAPKDSIWKREESINSKVNQGIQEVNQMFQDFIWNNQNRTMED